MSTTFEPARPLRARTASTPVLPANPTHVLTPITASVAILHCGQPRARLRQPTSPFPLCRREQPTQGTQNPTEARTPEKYGNDLDTSRARDPSTASRGGSATADTDSAASLQKGSQRPGSTACGSVGLAGTCPGSAAGTGRHEISGLVRPPCLTCRRRWLTDA
jgi:hypothetical protein